MCSALAFTAGALAVLVVGLLLVLNQKIDDAATARHQRSRARAAARYYRETAQSVYRLTRIPVDVDKAAAGIAAASGDDLTADQLRAEAERGNA